MNPRCALLLLIATAPLGGCGLREPLAIEFVAPADGSNLSRDEAVTFTVFVDGDLRLIDPATVSNAVDGEGHWHLNAVTAAGRQTLAMTASSSITIDLGDLDLPTGLVTFEAELRDNNHEPIDGAESDVVELVLE